MTSRDQQDPDANPLLDQTTVSPDASPALMEPVLPAIGTHVDRYELKREIARGAMGVVYLAWQSDLRRQVALKMILVGEDDQKMRDRFESESRAAAALDHPGIVPVFDVGTWQGRPYFAMGFVEGPSLMDLLRDGPLVPERAALLMRDLATAIGHAHQKQIIHRDLKPANILLAEGDKVRITDFGVSKLMTGSSDLTSQGEMVGTPHYMPPEQAGGSSQPISAASDIYSVGAVLYAMLTGRPPFVAASPVDVVMQVVTNPPMRPSALIPSVPRELEVITLKCLNKKQANRYPSAEALADDLGRWLRGEPIHAKPPGVLRRTQQFIRHHLIFASVSGSASLALIAVVFVLLFSYLHSQRQMVELNEEVTTKGQIIDMQRGVISRLIDAQVDHLPDDERRILRMEILAATASDLEISQPDMAIQLSIGVMEIAAENDLKIPSDVDGLIRSLLVAKGVDLTDKLTSDQLLGLAKQHVDSPMSVEQLEALGVPVDKALNQNPPAGTDGGGQGQASHPSGDDLPDGS